MRVNQARPRYAVGLTRVSTAEQGQSGFGLEAQLASVGARRPRPGHWQLRNPGTAVAAEVPHRQNT